MAEFYQLIEYWNKGGANRKFQEFAPNKKFLRKKILKFFKEFIHITLGFLQSRKLFVNGICFEKTRSYMINQLYNFYYIFKNNIKFYKNFLSNKESNKEFYDSITYAKPAEISPLLRFKKLTRLAPIKPDPPVIKIFFILML